MTTQRPLLRVPRRAAIERRHSLVVKVPAVADALGCMAASFQMIEAGMP